MMTGPTTPAGLTIGDANNPIGQVSDTMMTIADILGVMPEVQNAGTVAPGTQSLFNYI